MRDIDLGVAYGNVRRRVTATVRSMSVPPGSVRVPTCPEWSVHDLVAHLSGVCDDALNGRMDGVTTDPWTAAQVERGRSMTTDALLTRWDEQGPVFEAALTATGMSRVRALIDAVTHEHDLYTALGYADARDSDELAVVLDAMGASSFEQMRAMLGRRSARQIAELGMSPGSVVFGPASGDVNEPSPS